MTVGSCVGGNVILCGRNGLRICFAALVDQSRQGCHDCLMRRREYWLCKEAMVIVMRKVVMVIVMRMVVMLVVMRMVMLTLVVMRMRMVVMVIVMPSRWSWSS